MSTQVRILKTTDILEWSNYIKNCSMSDITHTPEYCKIFEDYGDGIAECFIFEDEFGFILYPYIIRNIPECPDYFDITTPYGYGGYIWSYSHDLEKFITNFREEFTTYAKSKKILTEFIRFHPKNDGQELSTHLLDSLTLHSWNPILDLTVGIEEQKKLYRSGHLFEIKKALKNNLRFELVSPQEYLGDFFLLYREQMKIKKQTGYVNFNETFFKTLLENIDEHLLLGVIFKEEEIVSMAIFIKYGNYLDYFLSATNQKFYKVSGNHFLIHSMSEAFRNEGGIHFHLGGGHASLMYFKSGFSKYKRAFYVGKNIFDEKSYLELTQSHYEKNETVWDGQNDFFPSYRKFEIGG